VGDGLVGLAGPADRPFVEAAAVVPGVQVKGVVLAGVANWTSVRSVCRILLAGSVRSVVLDVAIRSI
jgi:hypothetical protein